MSEPADDTLPSRDHHEGGFRPLRIPTIGGKPDISQGGPHYAEFIAQVRGLMNRVRMASPTDELALDAIGVLKELNARLDDVLVDEWSVPSWVRPDLPAGGSITQPPFFVDRIDDRSADTRITFETFHLGGNAAAHGGFIALAFDSALGMVAATSAGQSTRTASLTVDYRSITPLDTELHIHSWIERREGRKIFVRGELRDGDRLCAESHGLFLVLKPGQQ